MCTCRAGCLDNVVLCSSVDVLKGWLDKLLFWLPQCWGLPVKQLGVFPHLLLVHRARLCWGGGGSVANMGLVSVYRRGL